MGGETVSQEVVDTLNAQADQYDWVGAAISANGAAGYQLATGHPVMPIGGFNGSDPYPTLEVFQEWVREGRVHYFIASGGFGDASMQGVGSDKGRESGGSAISTWVSENYTPITVDGVTLYNLSPDS